MTDSTELLARLSYYRLVHALTSKPADRAAIDDHIAELERKLNLLPAPDAGEETGYRQITQTAR